MTLLMTMLRCMTIMTRMASTVPQAMRTAITIHTGRDTTITGIRRLVTMSSSTTTMITTCGDHEILHVWKFVDSGHRWICTLVLFFFFFPHPFFLSGRRVFCMVFLFHMTGEWALTTQEYGVFRTPCICICYSATIVMLYTPLDAVPNSYP